MDESAQTMQELTSNCMWKKSSVYLFHLFMYSKMIPPTCACVLCLLLMCLFCICLLLPQGWKKRWCELSDHLFRYYKNDSVRPMYFHFPPRIYTTFTHQYVSLIISIIPQDKEPAGIIYAEDIQDVVQDLDEAQRDISKVWATTVFESTLKHFLWSLWWSSQPLDQLKHLWLSLNHNHIKVVFNQSDCWKFRMLQIEFDQLKEYFPVTFMKHMMLTVPELYCVLDLNGKYFDWFIIVNSNCQNFLWILYLQFISHYNRHTIQRSW